jgi:hypothetical protein
MPSNRTRFCVPFFILLSFLSHEARAQLQIGWNDLGPQSAPKNANTLQDAGACYSSSGSPCVWGESSGLNNYAISDEFPGKIGSWSGGCYDPFNNRFLVTGGGHEASLDNSVLQLSFANNTFSRAYAPTPFNYNNYGYNSPTIDNGMPASAEVYGGIACVARHGIMVQVGQGLPGGDWANTIWQMPLTATLSPSNWNLTVNDGYGWHGGIALDDPNNDVLWMVLPNNSGNSVYHYTYSTKTVSSLDLFAGIPFGVNGAIDTVDQVMVLAGNNAVGVINPDVSTHIAEIDYSNPTQLVYHDITADAAGTCDGWANTYAPGVAFDPNTNLVVGYGLDGGLSVYRFNPSSSTRQGVPPHQCAVMTVGALSPPGGITTAGIWSKWIYIPSLKGYLYVSSANNDSYIYLLQEDQTPGPPDTTPPSVFITAPANGATVSGSVTVTADATDNVAVSTVQFQLDGARLGAPVTGSGPLYNLSWNTTTASNTSHTLTAVATDTYGNTASSSISVTVSNPPLISAVAAGSVSSSGATITWTTSTASSSQVAYGTTASYGSTSPLNGALVTSHSVVLSGLAASTTYHFQVLSRDAQGRLASSADFTFSTSAPGLQSVFSLNGSPSEAPSTANGSVVTPLSAPSGFTGLVVNNGGSVNFTSGQSSGVYFLNCCSNSGNAYYQFTGSQIGSIFNIGRGQISFVLTSRQSWAQRHTAAGSQARTTFDVRDGNGNHLFDFSVYADAYASGSVLFFNYAAAGAAKYFAIPSGYEDQLFGLNASVKVRLTWDGSNLNLYITNLQSSPTIYATETLVESTPYTPATPNWSSSSNFDIGANQYLSSGYNSSDDVISMFAVSAPVTQPVISAVAAGSVSSSGATITWTTSTASSSQVAYGGTTSYGSTSPLNSALVTSHSVVLSGLAASTTYHFQVLSRDAQGNLAASADFTFSTSAPGLQSVFNLNGSSAEAPSTANSSPVTPTLAPSGFIGSVVNTGGSVKFTSGQNPGVYFLSCCSNSDNAYYQFTGSQIGSVFNIGGGQVSFILTSRQSWAQRQTAAGSQARSTFDVRDGNGNHLFYFSVYSYTYASGSVLFFNYAAAGAAKYFAIPSGYEDQLFGLNASVRVRLTWNGSNLNLYLTNLQSSPTIYATETLVESTPYTPATPNWSSSSNFDIGAYQYLNSGYNSSDDVISLFSVSVP